MTPKDNTLDPEQFDPFEPYHAVFVDKKRLQWFLAGAMGLNTLLVLVLLIVAMRPVHVIVKDRITGAQPVLRQTAVAPAITATDARIFFVNMLKLRFGWDSEHLDRDMRTYLGQCLKEQRTRELAYLRQSVPHAGQGHVSRMQAWQAAQLHNTLVWPQEVDDTVCSPGPQGLWQCEITAQLVTQKSLPTSEPQPPVSMTFLAALYPVHHTVHTPSGLVVDSLQHIVLDHGRTP